MLKSVDLSAFIEETSTVYDSIAVIEKKAATTVFSLIIALVKKTV